MQFVSYNDSCLLRGIPLLFLFMCVSFFLVFFMFLVTLKHLFTCYLSSVICAKQHQTLENERKHVWYKYCSVFELSLFLEAAVVSKYHLVSELSVQFFREV